MHYDDWSQILNSKSSQVEQSIVQRLCKTEFVKVCHLTHKQSTLSGSQSRTQSRLGKKRREGTRDDEAHVLPTILGAPARLRFLSLSLLSTLDTRNV